MPDAMRLLPIFPLESVVLFPDVEVPLYIFEPRYRQMTTTALLGTHRIGMVTTLPPNAPEFPPEQRRGSDPPVFRVGCEGDIREAERHDDGTYHIRLHGTRRFRICEEIPSEGDRLYRVARVEPLADDAAPGLRPGFAALRVEVLDLLRRLAPDRAQYLRPELFEAVDDVRFVNAFCQAVDFPTLEKQQLLEANGVRSRVDQLLSLLHFRLAERSVEASAGTETLH